MSMAETVEALRKEMVGHYYRHYLGGLYHVVDVVIDEATEEVRVIYYNLNEPTQGRRHFWRYEGFVKLIDGVPRFRKISDSEARK